LFDKEEHCGYQVGEVDMDANEVEIDGEPFSDLAGCCYNENDTKGEPSSEGRGDGAGASAREKENKGEPKLEGRDVVFESAHGSKKKREIESIS